MPHTLKNLIIASGYAGTAGQSFRNNVTGAATGTKMSDYIGTAASWDSHTFLGIYDPNLSFQCNLTFTENSRAYLIRRRGIDQGVIILAGDTQVIKANEILPDPFGANYVTVTANGRLDISSPGIDSTFTVPASPYGSPGSGGPVQEVRFIASVKNTGAGSSFIGWNLILPQNAIGYPFNDYVSAGGLTGTYGAEVRNRGPNSTEYDLEWYNDSDFTSFFASGASVNFTQSFVGQDKTLYLRWRLKPEINGGQTTWFPYNFAVGQTFRDNR